MKHRLYGMFFLAGAAFGIALSASASGKVLWKADFADKDVWLPPRSFERSTVITVKPDSLSVHGTATNNLDTAWEAATKKQPFRHRGRYSLVFTFSSRGLTKPYAEPKPAWDNCVLWYGKDGVLLDRHQIDLVFADIPPHEYRYVRAVPDGAESFSLKFGWDTPNMTEGAGVCFRDLRIEAAAADAPLGVIRPDTDGPRVRIVSETPTEDAGAPVRVSVTDVSGVDPSSITLSVDGTVRKDFTVRAVKDGVELTVPCGARPWTSGLHWFNVRAADGKGFVSESKKCFLVGERTRTPPVTLRDDGMTLIDGKPFFPIGIYAVSKRDFNAYDWNRAVSDLKAAGFNFLHSYHSVRDPEFHAAVERHGMKMWMRAYEPDKAIVDTFRHCPWIIAWYLGDDTSLNTSVGRFVDRDDNIRAVDTSRLTTQADMYHPVFDLYAPASDNFLPEIYPVGGKDRRHDRRCVARVKSTMRKSADSQALDRSGRRHSIWPIIQQFKGWGWKSFPTEEEFYGMCFASIAAGAQGITLYTYGGFYNGSNKTYNKGVTFSERIWTSTTNCMRRIASLAPVLTERTPVQPPAPRILSGPERDELGEMSVSALYKQKDGVKYLIAVNSADCEVKASFSPSAFGSVEVLWEDRRIPVDAKGRFEDTFRPLAVHVYRWR